MIIVDSSVWIDYFNGKDIPEVAKLDRLLGQELLGVGDLILTEVLQGFRQDKEYQTAKQLLTSLTVFEMLGKEMAIKSAERPKTGLTATLNMTTAAMRNMPITRATTARTWWC